METLIYTKNTLVSKKISPKKVFKKCLEKIQLQASKLNLITAKIKLMYKIIVYSLFLYINFYLSEYLL